MLNQPPGTGRKGRSQMEPPPGQRKVARVMRLSCQASGSQTLHRPGHFCQIPQFDFGSFDERQTDKETTLFIFYGGSVRKICINKSQFKYFFFTLKGKMLLICDFSRAVFPNRGSADTIMVLSGFARGQWKKTFFFLLKKENLNCLFCKISCYKYKLRQSYKKMKEVINTS